jgi:hypothetical protein
MKEYQKAMRMPVLQHFNDLETGCGGDVIHEMFFIILEEVKMSV